jgi:hypothetical protein
MQDLNRVRLVTSHFHVMQGLRMVPIGVFLIAQSAGWLGRQGDCTLTLPSLIGAIVLYVFIGVYYRRSFGQVERPPQARQREWLYGLASLLVFYALVWVDSVLNLPVSLVGLLLAGGLLGAYLRTGLGFRKHYAVSAALLALVSLLPALGLLPRFSLFGPDSTPLTITLGAIVVLSGVFDHLLLVRTLKPLPEETRG